MKKVDDKTMRKALTEIERSIKAVKSEKEKVIRLIIAVDAILSKYGIE